MGYQPRILEKYENLDGAETPGNLITNGDFETTVSPWTTGGTNSIAVDPAQAKFGARSARITYSNNALAAQFAPTVTAVQHQYSVWLYIPTAYDGTDVHIRVDGYVGATNEGVQFPANLGLRDQWQKVDCTFTPVGTDLAGAVRVVFGGTAPSAGQFIYIDGARLEVGFTALPFSVSVAMPLADYEWESSQGLRSVQSAVVGAHYGFDHRGSAPGVKDFAHELLRCTVREDDPGDVDTLIDEFMAGAWSIGLGKLYTIDHDNVRRWAYARLASMPGLSWRAGMIFAKTVQVEFIRMSDWHDSGATISMVETPGNLITNGNFETDTTGWFASGTNTIAVSTEQAKFGFQSCKSTFSNNATLASQNITLTASTQYQFSAWLYIPSDWDGAGTVAIRARLFTGATNDAVNFLANMGIRDAWQRVVCDFTLAADVIGVLEVVSTGGTPTAGRSIYLDGARCELGATASDFLVEGAVPATGTVVINNPGNAPVYDAVLILKGTFTDPAITNTTNGYVLSSTRDGAATSDWLKFDAGRHTVEFSSNSGVVYANDFANFVRAATQVGLMKLEPGNNSFTFTGMTSATLAWSFSGAWH